jgi:hypothetical protein
VAPIPFLWILPLTLDLLTFVICFDRPGWYRREWFMPLLAAALGAMAWLYWAKGRVNVPILPTIAIFGMALFVCCMVCHGELVRLRPHPRHLTLFYVMISAGGAAGGLFVGLLAPNFLRSYYEFPIGMAFCAALALAALLPHAIRLRARVPLLVAFTAYMAALGYILYSDTEGARVVVRNFYGRLKVSDTGPPREPNAARKLIHGTVNHGQQLLDPAERRRPVSYFCPETGIGRAFLSRPEGVPWRIGILGMGCGTRVAYARPGDTVRIYEINPLVPELARSQFTYLADSPAKIQVVLGDGRLELEREHSQQFDILVMDAFSGDSVPIHLVTIEAFRTYLRHMKPGGILAVNISNGYLDLNPVMQTAARRLGQSALFYHFDPQDDEVCFAASWVLMMSPARRASAPPQLVETSFSPKPAARFRPWTDDYSNMLAILK